MTLLSQMLTLQQIIQNPRNMDFFYLGILIFLFVLATFDLSVGVANDAVNFLSPAVGAKAAKFRAILIVAAIGIFVGARLLHFERKLFPQ